MNDGIIIGQVVDQIRATGLEHVSVSLNHVQVSSERGPLPVRSITGGGLVQATTDGGGWFLLGFKWEPARLGEAIQNPRFQVNLHAQLVQSQGRLLTARLLTRHTGDLAVTVSLRAIADGRIPDLRHITTSARTVLEQGMRILREMRQARVPNSSSPARRHNLALPNMFLNPGRPSPEYYALLGAAQIRVSAPAGMTAW